MKQSLLDKQLNSILYPVNKNIKKKLLKYYFDERYKNKLSDEGTAFLNDFFTDLLSEKALFEVMYDMFNLGRVYGNHEKEFGNWDY